MRIVPKAIKEWERKEWKTNNAKKSNANLIQIFYNF